MQPLDPILVEKYTRQFDQIIKLLKSASSLLLPDAFEMQKQQLDNALQMVMDQKALYDSILNSLSVGVLFQEGVQIRTTAEQSANRTVTGLLWSSLDLISNIILFRSDFADFMESISADTVLNNNLKDFVLVESQVDSLCDELLSAADLIFNVISSLDE